MTVNGVIALFFQAFYILFESTSCMRLKASVAKRDIFEEKEAIAQCLHVAL